MSQRNDGQREANEKYGNLLDNAAVTDDQATPLAAAPKPVTLVVDDVPWFRFRRRWWRRRIVICGVTRCKRHIIAQSDACLWRQALQTVIASAGLVLREEGGIFLCPIRRPGSANSRSVKHRTGPAGSLAPPALAKHFVFIR